MSLYSFQAATTETDFRAPKTKIFHHCIVGMQAIDKPWQQLFGQILNKYLSVESWVCCCCVSVNLYIHPIEKNILKIRLNINVDVAMVIVQLSPPKRPKHTMRRGNSNKYLKPPFTRFQEPEFVKGTPIARGFLPQTPVKPFVCVCVCRMEMIYFGQKMYRIWLRTLDTSTGYKHTQGIPLPIFWMM